MCAYNGSVCVTLACFVGRQEVEKFKGVVASQLGPSFFRMILVWINWVFRTEPAHLFVLLFSILCFYKISSLVLSTSSKTVASHRDYRNLCWIHRAQPKEENHFQSVLPGFHSCHLPGFSVWEELIFIHGILIDSRSWSHCSSVKALAPSRWW